MTYRVDWAALPLGQVTDAEVAQQVGCTKACVSKRRVKLGILAKGPKPRKPYRGGRNHGRLTEVVNYGAAELQMSDAEMGRELCLSRERIGQLRTVPRAMRKRTDALPG